MTKEEKLRKLSEERYLDRHNLGYEHLRVIRKLIAPSTQIKKSVYSRRTIEAILQGRRRNGSIMREAILLAKNELDNCNRVMAEIDAILNIIPEES